MFLPITISMIIIFSISYFHYLYLGKKNRESIYLLLRIPRNAQEDSELNAVLQSYLKVHSRISTVFVVLEILLTVLLNMTNFSNYTSFVLLSFLVPLFFLFYLYNANVNVHRVKLLNLKMEKNWNVENSNTVLLADLNTSRLKNQYTPKHYLFAVPIIITSLIFLYFRAYEITYSLTLLFVLNLIIHFTCFGFHYFISHSSAKMYSSDSNVNLAINQEYRRQWSIAYLILSFIQSIFMLLIILTNINFINEGAKNMEFLFLMIFLFALLPTVFISLSHFKINHVKKNLLTSDKDFSINDEDSYYEYHSIFGFQYNNPNNPSAIVPKSIGIGQALNIGHKNGKILFAFSKILLTIVLIGVSGLVLFEDFVQPLMFVYNDKLIVERTIYPITVKEQNIEKIEYIEHPYKSKSLLKNVGSATKLYLRGNFMNREKKNVKLYVFRENPKCIVFTLKNMENPKLYFNYKESEATEKLLSELKEKFPDKFENSANSKPDQTNQGQNSNANTNSNQDNKLISELKAKRKAFVDSEIDYSIPAGEGTLHVVLNLPNRDINANPKDKIPVVLIVGGSGPSTKEGVANIYMDLARLLVDEGIACIRYDKRGIARSNTVCDVVKDEEKLVIEDFASDAREILKKANADDRFSKVYAIGHSEGSLVSMLAIQEEAVDGFISLAGPGRNIGDITLEQIKSNPYNPKDITENSEKIINTLKEGKRFENVPQNLNALFRTSVQPYFISWMKYSPVDEIKKLKDTKILIIQGDNDMQVQVLDAQNLYDAVPESKLSIISKLTHAFKDSPIQKEDMYKDMVSVQEYSKVYQDDSLPINPSLISEISKFILESL